MVVVQLNEYSARGQGCLTATYQHIKNVKNIVYTKRTYLILGAPSFRWLTYVVLLATLCSSTRGELMVSYCR